MENKKVSLVDSLSGSLRETAAAKRNEVIDEGYAAGAKSSCSGGSEDEVEGTARDDLFSVDECVDRSPSDLAEEEHADRCPGDWKEGAATSSGGSEKSSATFSSGSKKRAATISDSLETEVAALVPESSKCSAVPEGNTQLPPLHHSQSADDMHGKPFPDDPDGKKLAALVKGALLNVGVFPNHWQFDDLTQELSIVVLEWRLKYPERELELWKGYLFTLLCWRGRNLRRREGTVQERQNSLEQLLEAGAPEESVTGCYELEEERVNVEQVLAKLRNQLNENEMCFLELALLGWSMSAIAGELRVSRNTVYRWRKKIQEKYAKVVSSAP